MQCYTKDVLDDVILVESCRQCNRYQMLLVLSDQHWLEHWRPKYDTCQTRVCIEWHLFISVTYRTVSTANWVDVKRDKDVITELAQTLFELVHGHTGRAVLTVLLVMRSRHTIISNRGAVIPVVWRVAQWSSVVASARSSSAQRCIDCLARQTHKKHLGWIALQWVSRVHGNNAISTDRLPTVVWTVSHCAHDLLFSVWHRGARQYWSLRPCHCNEG